MRSFNFCAPIVMINGRALVQLPQDISKSLPSKGMNYIQGELDQRPFEGALEPDGSFGHWFIVDASLLDSLTSRVEVDIAFDLLAKWPAPDMPEDFYHALKEANLLMDWYEITTKAQWEWLRWLRFTNSAETHNKRIAVAIDKLRAGKKRPCCFDQTRCTDLSVSKNGILLKADK